MSNIPKLRFKEFTDEWQAKKIGDFSITYSGGTPTSSNSRYYNNGQIPFIKSGEISSLTTEKKITEEALKNSSAKLVEAGDILYALYGATSGQVSMSKVNGAINQAILCIKPKANSYFIYSKLLAEKDKILNTYLQGGQGNLSADILKKLQIALPSAKEQEKIADFLTAVDEKISKLDEKKAGFDKYKKCVIQAIFGQKIRFRKSDGSNYSDWEEKKLGEIGAFKTSGIDKLFYPDQKEVHLINYMNVYRHEAIDSGALDSLSETTVNERQLSESSLQKGDILFTPSSETPDDIGHSVVIKEDLASTVFSYHLLRFRPKINLNIRFSHYFCNIQSVLKQISQRCQGSTRFTITVGEFSKVRVSVPNSLDEQGKIADFLADIDNKIELINKELEGAKKFKKALLQQLFV